MKKLILRHSINFQFSKFWGANTISSIGDGIAMTALPLLIASMTRDPKLVALETMFATLPWLFFTLISGSLADRINRRRIIVNVDLFRGIMFLILGILVWQNWISIYMIFLFSFSLTMAQTLFDPAAQAILPSIVKRNELENANSKIESSEIIFRQFIGQALGGVLFVSIMFLPFVLNSISYFISALLLFLLKGSFKPKSVNNIPNTSSKKIIADILEGVNWIFYSRYFNWDTILEYCFMEYRNSFT